jgi:hypothetical protein
MAPRSSPAQIGAFSGITRSHDRGMSGGGCSNTANAPVPAAATGWGPNAGDCSVVEPWNVSWNVLWLPWESNAMGRR